MFNAMVKGTWNVITVYAVDFNHDAFLVDYNGKFKWLPMDKFEPVGDATCQE